jgi:urease accessory protein
MVAFAVRVPLGVAAVIVGAFAVFHGYAHGAELPASATPLAYSAGFVVATGMLHASGIAIGALIHWRAGVRVVRACGVVIAVCGLWFLFA